ncbi:hypothetical protein LTR28_000879 [Elasticomyces elasticus]|nr:hypothetical protein LTR28_000879 [Elasticomyces elasticus]
MAPSEEENSVLKAHNAELIQQLRDHGIEPKVPSAAPPSKTDIISKEEPSISLSPEACLKLITDNLQESLNLEIIEAKLKNNQAPSIYWGTATTGRPHCGYFVPGLKIAQFLRAGCRVTILLADIHAFLDNEKAPFELVVHRAKFYRFVITEMLKAAGVSTEKLAFVLGSDYQLSKEYSLDLLRMSTKVSEHDAKRAGAEVVKQSENAPLSGLLYPLMQALDEEYLHVDAQFGGVDQRKIFALAKEMLPRIGYKERAHLMNALVPGLAGGKMSSSDPDSKIDLLDDAAAVQKKIRKAYAMPRTVQDNGLISFIEFVLLPAGALLRGGEPRFVVERRADEGEGTPLVYSDIAALKRDYEADVLTPQLLKSSVTVALTTLLQPIQAAFQASPEWQRIARLAYPPAQPEKPEKKKKEKKDKGKFHPGAKQTNGGLVAQPDGHVEGPGAERAGVMGGAREAMEKLDMASEAVREA